MLSSAGLSVSNENRSFGLDLARATAILAVLQAHVGGTAAGALDLPVPIVMGVFGALGVELFFVLSGFLIGNILLEICERSPTTGSWLRFLVRRWMRTVPLYLVWLAILLVLWPPNEGALQYALSYMSFTQNLAWPMEDYWFGVSWSLSVEEWFYLLFSAVLIGLSATLPRRALVVSCCLFVIVPLLLRFCFGNESNLDAGLRKIVVFRLDAITYGVAIVALRRCYPSLFARQQGNMFLAGLVIFAAACFFMGSMTLTSWSLGLALWPLGLALCLPAFATLPPPRPAVERVVRFLSFRSYGLYIVHLSILQVPFSRLSNDFISLSLTLILKVGIALILADILYRVVERPIMRLRPAQFPVRPNNPNASPSHSGALRPSEPNETTAMRSEP